MIPQVVCFQGFYDRCCDVSCRSRALRLAMVAVVGLFGCDRPEPLEKPMLEANSQVSDATTHFHNVVENGSLDELRLLLNGGVATNAAGRRGTTALMLAIEANDLEKVKLLLQHGADPELTNDYNETALRRAVSNDFPEAVQLLLSLGADRGYHPKYPLKKIDYRVAMPERPMPDGLKSFMSDAEWKESTERTNQSIREIGQNPTVQPMISDVQSVPVLKLFLEAGDDLNLAHTDVKRALIGLETETGFHSTLGDYQAHKSPQYGSSNPEMMDFRFWRDMVRLGGNAYSARVQFNDTKAFMVPGRVWCYERYGASLIPLTDGRFVQIGGEHEDYYDPDFCIYNDVVIHDGRGGFHIYGYPKDVFPPTDFHSATLCRDGIYVIGGLGYPDQRRPGFTPVYRLSLESWQFESVKTTGEMPGWIHDHQARYDAERNTIRLSSGEIHSSTADGEFQLIHNAQEFELRLSDFTWSKAE